MTTAHQYRTFTTLNRRYEEKYFPKVKAVIIPVGLIPTINVHGVHAGIQFLHNTVNNTALTLTIRSLYVDVGLRHAQMNYSRMRDDIRAIGRVKALSMQFAREFLSKSPYPYQDKDESVVLETKAAFGFNPTWTKFIVDFLQRFLIEKITFEVSANTRQQLLKVLNQSITEGWGIDETVKRIEDLPFTEMQAARIVRTEVNRAANVGAKAQSETFAFEQMKEWISAEDSRVRGTDPKDHASHVSLDGQRINDGDVFRDPRNGDLLEFPGDPRASAESTINCRCQVAYVAKRDQSGRLIPKRQTTTVIFPNQNIRRQTVMV